MPGLVPKEPAAVVRLEDFPGMMTNVDPRDAPAGAADLQVNAVCVKAAELQIRGGLKPVVFDAT